MGKTKAKEGLTTTASLETLQMAEQRRVLDAVTQMRNCGLEDVLSIPQLVVCGDQSAGKSSVLEAITEIPFPRDDNLCTRFATEITLRRSELNSITVKVLPDSARSAEDKETIKAFTESITNFDELPVIIQNAMSVMELNDNGTQHKAFCSDTLSIEIAGPSRPQLTLVDLPGLIQNESKGVTSADVQLVAEITDRYVSQPRTICLAVVSATNDYVNQGILTKVKKVDPAGQRTLGIITKPDRLPTGSGSEKAFISLARNEDIFLTLGWHVLKNRTYEEQGYSFAERNRSEALYFSKSNWRCLSNSRLGVVSLVERLSWLLFEHIKRQLPHVQAEIDNKLAETQEQLSNMGKQRRTPQECREYLMQLSLNFHMVCKAAVDGHYEGEYFNQGPDEDFTLSSPIGHRRLRAVIQMSNSNFCNEVREKGHTYHILKPNESTAPRISRTPRISKVAKASSVPPPKELSHSEAVAWARRGLASNRGRELHGNFSPMAIGELFWQQSSKWEKIALAHMEAVTELCSSFLRDLLSEKCPADLHERVWSFCMEDVLNSKHESAKRELDLLVEELRRYPINYNHYYTDTVKKCRQERADKTFAECIKEASIYYSGLGLTSNDPKRCIDTEKAVKIFSNNSSSDMDQFNCEEALDCLLAIYKVSQKTFIANVTTQVIERHLLRDLENIFSPIVIGQLSDQDVEGIASEPPLARALRSHLESRISKLEEGRNILRETMVTKAV